MQQARLSFGEAQAVPPGQFHPAVLAWLTQRFGQPTDVQREAWKVTLQHRHALIAAPTGSGKTLAAFLAAINDLVTQGLHQPLPDEVQVLYVSPLKALSNDIQKNLQAPLQGIREQLAAMGLPDPGIRDAVRTGDTPTLERERQKRTPPHILVTTPESLYILLTSDSGRRMLGGVRSVIVDELHAVAGSKRGAHLMLSLERLAALCPEPPVRIGLSATVKPLDEMARFLVGGIEPDVTIVDTGHVRERDLGLEMPLSPLTAVMANEVWGEIYDRLAELTATHRTTLIFVNQRRVAERVARHLAERIGEEHVAAHHGSLAKEHRLDAEQRLKGGKLKALVATSSLELGIDIGDIDLVCQIGSPRAINAFLQRVGRAGHAIGAIPKGRLFPLSLDDLLECAALLDAVDHSELDRIRVPQKPLDVLSQQIVAEAACQEWSLEALYERFRRPQPYRELTLAEFENTVQMLAEGYTTRRGRRGAYLHYDAVNRLLRARRGAKITAVTNAGVIPDQFDSDVVLMPEEHRIGTIGEDFAFESIPGDIFQLGNTSYRIMKVEVGKVMVEDARGQPPNVPFWFGDALGRSDELCHAVSRLNVQAEEKLSLQGQAACEDWLEHDVGLPRTAAEQLTLYLAASQAALGALPNENTIILERFFDEVGDTHLVIHSPFGSRVNKAWGLALRKRFCRKFNFELQASALEDSIVLSLGPTHSFPLEEIKDYLKSGNAKDVLIQALLDAPMFGTRWRWNATVALAIRRMNGGKRVPPQFQRSDAEDLLTVVFPDQVACAENLVGEREIPDHPLVQQTLHDCLHETMDVDGFVALLTRIESGEVRVLACDLASPSPLSHAIINARPYAFLDDGEAEERRTRSITTQPLMDVSTAADLGRLDEAAIARVIEEAQPSIANADELHDALVVHAFLTESELRTLVPDPSIWLAVLQKQRRIAHWQAPGGDTLLLAAERLHEFAAVFPQADFGIAATSSKKPEAGEAMVEIVRNRLEMLGPLTAQALAAPFLLPSKISTTAKLSLLPPGEGGATAPDEGAAVATPLAQPHAQASNTAPLPTALTPAPLPGGEGSVPAAIAQAIQSAIDIALLHLEAEGAVMRGNFTEALAREWCDRRLLARMHRYTRERLRAEFQPVPPAQFLRFLFRWHGLEGEDRRQGEAATLAALRQLEGCAAPAGAWEEDLLPARVPGYQPYLLDKLCGNGRVVWYRPVESSDEARRRSGPVRGTPILLCERESLAYWQEAIGQPAEELPLSPRAQKVLDALRTHGASFYADLQHDAGLLGSELEPALGELVAQGLVTSDSFAGLRALVMPAERRAKLRRRLGRNADTEVHEAGRWSLARPPRRPPAAPGALAAPHVEHIARTLLRRYGVVFRKLLEREEHLPPWRELYYVYRRLEARGEVRGGRFVTGFAGEQFALPEAAAALRKIARNPPEKTERVTVAATDPLNLIGILTPGDKLPRQPGNRVLFENGVPVAVQSGGETRYLKSLDASTEWEVKNLLIRKEKPGRYIEGPARTQ